MGPRVRIEPMREGDVRDVATIEGKVPGREDDLRNELERPWSHAWVARDERGVAVAFVIAWLVLDEVHVLNLMTHPERRRRGCGRALMEEIVAFARRRCAKRVLLEVRRSNRPALALYRSLGFFVTGLRARYYADDEDAVEMALAFDGTGAVMAQPDAVNVGDR
jgi:ribosomal-protein-alanine N-acetyltransferase